MYACDPSRQIEMKMLFEVMDLAVASPATVSRIGVIYMTPSNLGWMPYVQSWVRRIVDHCRASSRSYKRMFIVDPAAVVPLLKLWRRVDIMCQAVSYPAYS